MKIVKYDPKETFGLVYKVYPWVNEEDTPKGWEFNYGVTDDGCIEIFGRHTSLDDAKKYLEGLSEAINLAQGAQHDS